ncbi:MAG: L-dopachrome tautomerase-related protein, partial [Myxococcota bacterium]
MSGTRARLTQMRRFLPATILAVACATAPEPKPGPVETVPEPTLAIETLAEVQYAPGNIAVAPDGTVYFTLHQFFAPPFSVAKLEEGKLVRAVPDLELVSPLGIAVDEAGTLWLLDNGLAKKGSAPRLIARAHNNETRVYELSAATPDNAFVNDLVIDLQNRSAYVADPAGGANAALIVVDLR